MRKAFFLVLLLTSCHRVIKPPPHIPPARRVIILNWPVRVRVKIFSFKNSFRFGIRGNFRVSNGTELKTGYYLMQLKNARKAKFLYYEIVEKSDQPFRKIPPGLFHIDVGAVIHLDGITIDNRDFYLLRGPVREDEIDGKIYREPYIRQAGFFELQDSSGRKILEARDSIVLYPEGGHFFLDEGDSITGKIIFTINTGGDGVVVVEEDLEDYIKHVLPAEMPPSFPFEALKAQAVVARTFAISHLGKSFRYQPYDFVGSVLSQAFSPARTSVSDSAVDVTRGIVLFFEGRVAQVFYHSTCGGHTEDIGYIWETREVPYLKGVKDGKFRFNLQDPVEVRLFLKSPPDSVLCNYVESPAIKRYVQKNFRWKVEFSRKEVEKMISNFLHQNIGRLKAIVPLSRGVSGRITEVLITGTRKNLTIRGEYRIRKLFGGLKSSLFYVDYERNQKGDIERVIFVGGGSGHGVGMCQVGAGILAERGFKMKDILMHYFPGVKGVKVY